MENEFKGTKGKWSCREEYDDLYEQHIISIDSVGEHRTSIVTVWSGLPSEFNINKETKANAKLISKAPYMLNMLKECSRVLGKVQSPTTPSLLLKREVDDLIKEATTL